MTKERKAESDEQRVGKFAMRVEFVPTPLDAEAKRIEALTTWLLSRWESERREELHAAC